MITILKQHYNRLALNSIVASAIIDNQPTTVQLLDDDDIATWGEPETCGTLKVYIGDDGNHYMDFFTL